MSSSAIAGHATIVGGDATERRHVERVLQDGGLTVRSQPEPGALLVLLGRANGSERVREIRTAAEAHPEARILAILAADAPNAALRRMLLAGATGIIFDDDVDRALVATARAMLAGQLAVPRALGRQIARSPCRTAGSRLWRSSASASPNA